MEQRTDVELLRAWRRGDVRAGRVLFDRLFAALRRFFGSKVESGVDDLIQSTLMVAVEKSDTLRDDTKFRAYLFTVARHELFRSLRTRMRVPKPFDSAVTSIADVRTSPSGVVQREQEHQVLVSALQQLPLDFQIALELHYWEGMKAREIAEVLDVATSTVTTRLARARALLSREIERLEATPGGAAKTSVELRAWAADPTSPNVPGGSSPPKNQK